MFSDNFAKETMAFLNRDDMKQEMKLFIRPLVDMILQELYPYVYMSMIFVFISFLLTLSIFVLVIRKNADK
jgi:hypothetical protein